MNSLQVSTAWYTTPSAVLRTLAQNRVPRLERSATAFVQIKRVWLLAITAVVVGLLVGAKLAERVAKLWGLPEETK